MQLRLVTVEITFNCPADGMKIPLTRFKQELTRAAKALIKGTDEQFDLSVTVDTPTFVGMPLTQAQQDALETESD